MIDFLDREPLPSAADRNEQQKWIALYDALDELPYVTVIPKGIDAWYAAVHWAAARGYKTTTIDCSLYVWKGVEVLFAVQRCV